jgi:Tol biopolymer transport system component
VGDGGLGVWTMGADGSRTRKLAGRGADDPDWSPSGTRIAYTQVRSGQEQIWTMRASGTDKRRLAAGAQPSWSPDGRRIAFVRSGRLFTVRAAGGDERKVAYTPRSGSRAVRLAMPAWQPRR